MRFLPPSTRGSLDLLPRSRVLQDVYCAAGSGSQGIQAVNSEWKKLADPRFVLQTQERAKCPLCKDFIGGNFNSSCSNCKTTYHNDCLLELTSSRCSTVGCNRFVQTVGEAKAEV